MTIKRFDIPVSILVATELVLLIYFPLSLIFEPTLLAGGDTPSHFLSALAVKDVGSFFSPVTWVHGNFAGFPLFLQYFPLPFMLMRLISFVTSIQVAFKLVSLLAIVPLPAAVYYSLRRLGFRGSVPALGAVLCLPFLVQQGNHMWGGNMSSTMAGEFAYGISFILTVLYIGKIFTDIPLRRSLAVNSFIEALIALGNGYPILQAGVGTSYFLIKGGSVRYVLAMHVLAFGLIGFWILPLLWFAPWNTQFAHSWAFQSIFEAVPQLLWPSIAGVLIGLAPHFKKLPNLILHPLQSIRSEPKPGPEQYLWWQFGVALLLFGLVTRVGLVDARLLPFAQIMLAMLGAIGWGKLIFRLPFPNVWLSAFAAAITLFSVANSSTVDCWIKYNYSGMESKKLWQTFSQTAKFLGGDENSPRVVWEHSEALGDAGTTRAFELLPYYAGRSALEGLYMQSSLTAPFVYYMQSEVSQVPSTPLPGYFYSRFDPAGLARRMRLFNANQVIAISANIQNGLDESEDFEFQAAYPPFRVYLLKDAQNSYVEPLRFQPFRISDSNWRRVQFEWFRKTSLQTPLIIAGEGCEGEFWKTVQSFDGKLGDLPEIQIAGAEEVRAEAVLSANAITVKTSSPGHPLWLKTSFHPSWRVARGEGEIYAASPSFILLVPKSSEVVLEFDTRNGIYLAGRISSLAALAVCLVSLAAGFFARCCNPQPVTRSAFLNATLIASAVAMAGAISISLFFRIDSDPQLLYNRANIKFERLQEIRAEESSGKATPEMEVEKADIIPEILAQLDRAISRFPDSYVFDHCFLLKSYLLLDRMSGSDFRDMIHEYLRDHSDTRVQSDLLYLAGESLLREEKAEDAGDLYYQASLIWPESNISMQAGTRLIEIFGSDAVFERASELFESGGYTGAYLLFKALSLSQDEAARDKGILFLAYSSFYMNRWEEASNLFLEWLNANFESPDSGEVRKVLLQCNILMDQNKLWQNSPEDDMPDTVIGKILRFFNLAD